MKRNICRLSAIAALLCMAAVLFSPPSLAQSGKKNVRITYRDIQIRINGGLFVPKDIRGNVVEPFILNGTTYLPIRAVGEATGYDVEWEERGAVLLSEPKDDSQEPLQGSVYKSYLVPFKKDETQTASFIDKDSGETVRLSITATEILRGNNLYKVQPSLQEEDGLLTSGTEYVRMTFKTELTSNTKDGYTIRLPHFQYTTGSAAPLEVLRTPSQTLFRNITLKPGEAQNFHLIFIADTGFKSASIVFNKYFCFAIGE